MRRRDVCVALCALAAVAALGHPPLLLGQERAEPSPGQNEGRIDDLSARVKALEEAAKPGTESRLTATYVILTAAAGMELVYLTAQAVKRRARPILSWSALDDGLEFAVRDMPDGSKRLAIRIANVGRAAAVDIVWHVGTMVSAHTITDIPLGPSPHFVGSLHPSASTQILIPVSGAEHARAMGGETVSFSLMLRYKSIDNRRYAHRVSGRYSRDSRFLVGTVSKSLPV